MSVYSKLAESLNADQALREKQLQEWGYVDPELLGLMSTKWVQLERLGSIQIDADNLIYAQAMAAINKNIAIAKAAIADLSRSDEYLAASAKAISTIGILLI